MSGSCAGTVFVAYAKKDSNDFTSPFIEEAEKLKLKIRTVDTFSLQCSTDPDWDSSPVPDKIRKYIRESICFVWIFSPAFLQDKKAAISSDADCEADSIPKLVDIIFDNFVVHGDAKYSSARMFTICHHTTREQLRDTDCVMASYAPLDSSCGPFIAAQLLKIKVEELQKMNLPDKESGEVQGEASTGKKSTKKDSRDATLPEQKCKGKRRLVTDKV